MTSRDTRVARAVHSMDYEASSLLAFFPEGSLIAITTDTIEVHVPDPKDDHKLNAIPEITDVDSLITYINAKGQQ